MKIQELRYGNIVDTEFGNGVFMGYNPTHKTAYVMVNNVMESVDINKLKPIPFSKEWSIIMDLKWLVTHNFRNVWSLWVDVLSDCKIDFKYVHEAQNIHYAVYGEELTINQ